MQARLDSNAELNTKEQNIFWVFLAFYKTTKNFSEQPSQMIIQIYSMDDAFFFSVFCWSIQVIIFIKKKYKKLDKKNLNDKKEQARSRELLCLDQWKGLNFYYNY